MSTWFKVAVSVATSAGIETHRLCRRRIDSGEMRETDLGKTRETLQKSSKNCEKITANLKKYRHQYLYITYSKHIT